MTTRSRLEKAVQTHIDVTREALQTVYDSLNQGQKKKLLKNEDIKNLFDFYGVIYEE